MTQHAELQVTSTSLRGASHPEEMALQAAAFGYAAIELRTEIARGSFGILRRRRPASAFA